jgi:hypothetical protein
MKIHHIFFLLLAFAGCNTKDKIIEKQQENLLMAAITNGQWVVTSFHKGSTDVTADFSGYKFQFKDNYTVDAIKNGIVEKTGTWAAAGNAQAQTMTSNFANSTQPLILLNGTWNIITTTWTSVEASMMVNSEIYTIRLDKQ